VSALLVAWMAGAPWGVACYVIMLSLITAVSVWWGPETHESDLADERGVSAAVPVPVVVLSGDR
jgi:hypothetical protein